MKSINFMKNVGRFTPPRNCQVRFTPNHLYDLPQIVYMIYPLPPEITKYDLPQIVCTIPPRNHQVLMYAIEFYVA